MLLYLYMEKIFNLNDIKNIAQEILTSIESCAGDNKSAIIIALNGELGAGKTTLVSEIAKFFSVKENVVSPTYVIMKKYPVSWKGIENFYHIDAYRIENEHEILVLGWEEIVRNPANLVFVEWPEKIQNHIPKNHIEIKLSHKTEEEREIILTKIT